MTFTGTMAAMPENMSLKARLAWKYFFDGGWAVVRAGDCYICTDEGMDLSTATIFPDEDALITWLETCASDHLNDAPLSFLRFFSSIPELINEEVANAICSHLD